MSKHAPGPWYHHGPSGSQHSAGGFVNNTPGRHDSPVVCSVHGTEGQPHQANARLIAAAPDLLAALARIASIENKPFGGDWDEIEEARSVARAAIAAATGTEAPKA